MKSEDLMIDDWVSLPSDAFAQVIGLASDGIFFKDGMGEGACSYDKIHPIPLTPEILEKNGFKYNDTPFVQGWEQFGLTLYHGGEGFLINCGENTAMKINAVHELQHALRLCGINKTIEL